MHLHFMAHQFADMQSNTKYDTPIDIKFFYVFACVHIKATSVYLVVETKI